MKFFVTGVGGQLGHDVMNELLKRGHRGVGSDIAPAYSGVADGSPVTEAPYVSLDITGPTLSIKVTQSALKLAKLPYRTVYQSQTAPLMVKLAVTSPANAKIGDVQLSAKTTAALRNTLEKAGGINFEADTVTFPASAFAALKPGRYTVILDVTPANAASDTKRIQARFTLTVQK